MENEGSCRRQVTKCLSQVFSQQIQGSLFKDTKIWDAQGSYKMAQCLYIAYAHLPIHFMSRLLIIPNTVQMPW